jgi:predicted dinucleotide-binding enzyme
MKISIIGSGNVGMALASALKKAKHEVAFAVRNPLSFKGKEEANKQNIAVIPLPEASQFSEVIIIAAVPQAVKEIAQVLGNVENIVIVDAMNSVRVKPEPFQNTTEALMQLTNSKKIVKCFNSTGAENMANPLYPLAAADMFMAGDNQEAKDVVRKLAQDIGFGEVYNFGGSAQFNLMEQFALSWINLAIMQGYGRGIAFKVMKR